METRLKDNLSRLVGCQLACVQTSPISFVALLCCVRVRIVDETRRAQLVCDSPDTWSPQRRRARTNGCFRRLVSQKHKKLHAAGLDDTAIPHIKIKFTDIPFEKKHNTVNPRGPLSYFLALLSSNNYS